MEVLRIYPHHERWGDLHRVLHDWTPEPRVFPGDATGVWRVDDAFNRWWVEQ